MKKEIEAFVNAANEQELEAAWNNLSAEEQRIFEQLMEEDSPEDALAFFAQLYDDTPKEQASETVSISENEIKNALISAQKLSEAAIREARHKAEIILKDAQMKADEKVASIADEVEEKKEELEKMRQIVSDFRKTLLDKYKEHLTLINNIPNRKKQVKLEEPKQPEPAEENKPKELHTQSLEEHMIEKTQPIDIKGAIGKEPSEEEADFASAQQNSQEAASRVASSIEVEEVDEAPTKKFHLNATSFEKAPEERRGRDLRYDVLKFGEDYNIAEDDDDEAPSSSRMKRNK